MSSQVYRWPHAKRLRIFQGTVERRIHESFEAEETLVRLSINVHIIRKGYNLATPMAELRYRRIYDVIKGNKHIDIGSVLISHK